MKPSCITEHAWAKVNQFLVIGAVEEGCSSGFAQVV